MNVYSDYETDNELLYDKNELLESFLSLKDLFQEICLQTCTTRRNDNKIINFFSKTEQEIFDFFTDESLENYSKDEYLGILTMFTDKL